MTFQPPPSPPGGTPPPPPPPPGQWGPPPGSGGPGGNGGFDPKSVNPLDWGILGVGFLTFIFSFFDWYTVDFAGISAGESAWHGFFGWFAVLLAIIGAGVVGTALFAPQVKLPFPARLTGLILFAVATLCVILALFVFPESVPDGLDTGRGFGYWASLIFIIAGLVMSLMRFQQTGGQLPGKMSSKVPNIGGYGPQGGISGSAAQGYGQPPQSEYGSQAPQAPGQYGDQQQPPPGYSPPPPGYSPPPPGYSPPPPGYNPPQQ